MKDSNYWFLMCEYMCVYVHVLCFHFVLPYGFQICHFTLGLQLFF